MNKFYFNKQNHLNICSFFGEKCLHFWVFVMFRHYTFVGFYYYYYWLLISFPVLATFFIFSFKFRSFHVVCDVFVPWTSSFTFIFLSVCPSSLSSNPFRILYAIYNFSHNFFFSFHPFFCALTSFFHLNNSPLKCICTST